VTTSSQLPPAISISTTNEEKIVVSYTTTLFSGELPHCPTKHPVGVFPDQRP